MRKYVTIGVQDLYKIPQRAYFSETLMNEILTVSEIYPFRTNEYVLNELIDWNNFMYDPVFRLNFPKREMLLEKDYNRIIWARENLSEAEFKKVVHDIRMTLNPHPASQLEMNVPYFDGSLLSGTQHKYNNTVLFFPSPGQTCHAYCTFCFRWPQFVGESDLKIGTSETDSLVQYLNVNPQVSEVLITGGDPMIMNSRVMESFILPLLEVKTLKNIRIGSKSLSFWPYKYLNGEDSEKVLQLFEKISQAGKHFSFMAHFNHPAELKPEAVVCAIKKIRATGAEIRTQSPLLNHINDNSLIWQDLWERQVELGCVPYYMFLSRDTGAQHYFSVPLHKALKIFRDAINKVNGLCKTVRGPIMSTKNGKIEILDFNYNDNAYLLRFIQHRNQELTYKCFYAKSKVEDPIWLDNLEPLRKEDKIFFSDSFNFAASRKVSPPAQLIAEMES